MYWGGGKLQRGSLFKYDVISLPRCLASSCDRFVFNSYPTMMQYSLLAALPPPVYVSYQDLWKTNLYKQTLSKNK